MDELPLWQQVFAIIGLVYLILIVVGAIFIDITEHWWHWLIYLGLIFATTGAWLVLQ